MGWMWGVVFFDEGRGMAELQLVEVGAMGGEELCEATACVGEFGGENG